MEPEAAKLIGAGIAAVAMAGAGVGIFAVRKSDLEIYFQLGAGYQSTRFVSVQPGEDIQEDRFSGSPLTAHRMVPDHDDSPSSPPLGSSGAPRSARLCRRQCVLLQSCSCFFFGVHEK